MYPESIKNLVESFKYLPGIGEKTAERLAFSILELEDEQISMFSESLKDVKLIARQAMSIAMSKLNDVIILDTFGHASRQHPQVMQCEIS